MKVLGIETSCDDTAVAVVQDGCHVLASHVSSQPEHARYGGIVPEIAARRHVEKLPALLEAALQDAGVTLSEVDGVGVTRGPGLIGALLAGWCYARGLARAAALPWVGVHHLEAHVHGALMPALAAGTPVVYPLVALVVSGGHTSLYRLDDVDAVTCIGKTRDDAAGEAFDKIAALLGLGFPGGPLIDRLSATGDAGCYRLPRPALGLDFSFSGLKTAARRLIEQEQLPYGAPQDERVCNLAASFQQAVVDVLADTTERAIASDRPAGLVLAGGVAANRSLRQRFEHLAATHGLPLHRSPPNLSTDNAAMIAGLAHRRLAAGHCDPWNTAARASWPLGVGGRG